MSETAQPPQVLPQTSQEEISQKSSQETSVETLQERIRILETQLRQAQKLAALGELTSTTTHEFNNALTTIINYAKLGMRHKDAAMRDKAFDRVLTAARRAEKITNSVLGFARNRSNEFEPTNLAKIVDDTLVLLEREMQRYRVTVETKLDAVPPVRAIGNQIQQVLMNLLTNARQAMPRGGTIVLRLASNAADGTVELTVRDTGAGIPQEKLPQIFDRYYTTKDGPDASGKGGTGVGLSTCRDIIQAHHGRIRVESSVGRGTAFIIKLPAAKAPEGAGERAPIQKLGVPVAAFGPSALPSAVAQ
jgi:signal transduction histidine kinase